MPCVNEYREVRSFPLAELRVIDDGGKPKIQGYAAVFNSKSEDLGGFREIVKPGAFKKTILESDIRALFNHDPNYVLGRKKSGTLALEEDEHGLKISVDPPDTGWARDLVTSVRRGDVDQMSFGFRTIKDEWENADSKEKLRSLVEVQLYDISPVTFPAYPETSVAVRELRALDQSKPTEPSAGAHSGEPVENHSHEAERVRIELELIELEKSVRSSNEN